MSFSYEKKSLFPLISYVLKLIVYFIQFSSL